jgi:transcription antitermination protein NusB
MFRVKYSREISLKILFQVDIQHLDEAGGSKLARDFLRYHARVTDEEQEYILGIVGLVLAQQEEMDKTITQHLIGWKLGRLSPVDRSLIRMGIAEAKQNGQKPIIIDDIIRIAKKYGESDSYKFINAILDKVIS